MITNIWRNFKPSFNVWQADIRDTQGHSHLLRSLASLATLDGWQHVAVTYDKASGTAALFFNGNVVTQANFGTFMPRTTGSLLFGYPGSSSSLYPPAPTRYYLQNSMDEIGIYDRALSRDEIRAIMRSRGAGKCREPPSIVSQPANLRINQGDAAVFAVTAAGNPILRYQWRHGGLNLPGATAASLLLSNVQLAQAGSYSVRVTNAFGTIVSSNANLIVNRPPAADASATKPMAIAPLHCNPTVILNGSRSSDPDGDLLNYFWFQAGTVNPLATSAVAVVKLPIGTNWLRLVVDDGLATNAQTFAVEVITTAQAVARVVPLVESGTENPHPLMVSLAAAMAALGRDEPIPAVNELQAFQNKLRAQVAPVAPAFAETLLKRSQEIIGVLVRDCGAPFKPKPKIGKVARDNGGNMRMEFTAEPGLIYIIEASTNLVDWEKVGVAVPSDAGGFEFEDPQAMRFSSRYYRIIVP